MYHADRTRAASSHLIGGGLPCIYHSLLQLCSPLSSVSVSPYLIIDPSGRKRCLRRDRKRCPRLDREPSRAHSRPSQRPRDNSRRIPAKLPMTSKPWM